MLRPPRSLADPLCMCSPLLISRCSRGLKRHDSGSADSTAWVAILRSPCPIPDRHSSSQLWYPADLVGLPISLPPSPPEESEQRMEQRKEQRKYVQKTNETTFSGRVGRAPSSPSPPGLHPSSPPTPSPRPSSWGAEVTILLTYFPAGRSGPLGSLAPPGRAG